MTKRLTLLLAVLLAPLLSCQGVGPFAPEGPPPGTVLITPNEITLLRLGETQTFEVQVVGGPTLALAQEELPTWTSSNPNVATVSPLGLVTAVGDGSATVTARVGAMAGTARVAVTATITHTATITAADQGDPNPNNNTASANVTISVGP